MNVEIQFFCLGFLVACYFFGVALDAERLAAHDRYKRLKAIVYGTFWPFVFARFIIEKICDWITDNW